MTGALSLAPEVLFIVVVSEAGWQAPVRFYRFSLSSAAMLARRWAEQGYEAVVHEYQWQGALMIRTRPNNATA